MSLLDDYKRSMWTVLIARDGQVKVCDRLLLKEASKVFRDMESGAAAMYRPDGHECRTRDTYRGEADMEVRRTAWAAIRETERARGLRS